MKRTVLYYPSINIPDGAWLRQAVFYFDEVASIVPFVHGDLQELYTPLSPEIVYLKSEEIYRPIFPEVLPGEAPYYKMPEQPWSQPNQTWQKAHQLGAEFQSAVKNESFRARLSDRFVRIYRQKLSDTNLAFLEGQGLLRYDAPADRKYSAEWFLVEEKTAFLYMSMLAQFLADLDPQYTVPGTDQLENEDMVYKTSEPANGLPSLQACIRQVLPVPRSDVALSDIVKFKRKRETELLGYRAQIDELERQLKQAGDRADLKKILVQFDERQRKEGKDLLDALRDAKIPIIGGSIKALISSDSPAIWGVLGVAAGVAASPVALPVAFTVAGIALVGAIEAGLYWLDRRNETRALERSSSFAYLFHGKAEGIL